MNGKVNVYIKNVDVIIIDVTGLCWSSLEVVIITIVMLPFLEIWHLWVCLSIIIDAERNWKFVLSIIILLI